MRDVQSIFKSREKQQCAAHRLVENVRTLRAAENEKTVPTAGCRVPSGFEEFLSDWIASHHRIGAFESCASISERDRDRRHEFREQAIREAGKGILLVNGRRNAAHFRGEKQRP